MKKILNKILTPKFALSALISVFFALLLRYFYLEVLELTLSIDKFDFTNLSFVSILSVFKIILTIIFDEIFPHALLIDSAGNIPDNKPQTVLMMEGKNHESSNKDLSFWEQDKLITDISKTAQSVLFTLIELGNLKQSKNIILFVGKDDLLSIDVPSTMSDKEASDISKKVSELDSTYNERLDHYKKLLARDKAFNKEAIGKSFSQSTKDLEEKYNSVYSIKKT